MNDTKLKELMSSYQQDFDPYFSTRVLARMQRSSNAWLSWKWLSPAFTLAVACLAILWVQDGSLSLDGLLGLSDYDTELNTYLMYF